MISVVALDGDCNIFYALKTLHIYVNIFDRVQLLASFPHCNGGKLEEAEDSKCIFVVNCVLEQKKDQLDRVNC